MENGPARRDEAADDEGIEFEGASPLMRAHGKRPPLLRALLLALPIALAVVVLLASQPALRAALGADAGSGSGATLTVLADVPWATVRVDGSERTTGLQQSDRGIVPATTLHLSAGIHALAIDADGFVPLHARVSVTPGSSSSFSAHLRLTTQARAGSIAAINQLLLGGGFAQQVMLPGNLWQALRLSTPPMSASLVVDERFEAIGLDPHLPVFNGTVFMRPVPPARHAIGVAAIVVEHTRIFDGCGGTLLAEHESPLIGGGMASMVFSVARGGIGTDGWQASQPYVLNPEANLYTDPSQAAFPATPFGLLTLAAQAQLASMLGNQNLLAYVVTPHPLASLTSWAAGLVFTTNETTGPVTPATPAVLRAHDAVWLYAGGVIAPLTLRAQTLTGEHAGGSAEVATLLGQGMETNVVASNAICGEMR